MMTTDTIEYLDHLRLHALALQSSLNSARDELKAMNIPKLKGLADAEKAVQRLLVDLTSVANAEEKAEEPA